MNDLAPAHTALAPRVYLAPEAAIAETESVSLVSVAPSAPLMAQASSNSGAGTAIAVFVPLVAAAAVIWLLNAVIRICDPNKILIVSGRQQVIDGRRVGYRVEFGGQTYCIPILETVKSMDMRTMPVSVEVKNAYARGGTPLDIQAIANVKISSDPVIVRNAIERFLDRDPKEIRRVARETLEGNLRGVVATLTPEQLNEDRLEFADRIANDVSDDLAKLGLHLDTLKIQSVSDNVDYLDSIGRKQIAVVLRDAEIAESDAIAEAEQVESDCDRQAEVAQTQAKTLIQQRQNALREIKATLDQETRSQEERTKAAADAARARAEKELQTIRAELERLRLEVEQVLPADAQRQARESLARGAAASFTENAKAAATVNDLLAKVWRDTGDSAAELFALQQLETILHQAARVPERLKLKQINAIDRGDGKTLSGLLTAYPAVARDFLTQAEQILQVSLMGGRTPIALQSPTLAETVLSSSPAAPTQSPESEEV